MGRFLKLAGFLACAQLLCAGDPGPTLFSEVAARNQLRDAGLQCYSVLRTYEVTNAAGRVRAACKVLVRYDPPHPKSFQVLEQDGSHVIDDMVLRPLMQHEAKASSGATRQEAAISPANYEVELLGEDNLDGRPCYVLRATPRRRDKYLFEGRIWIDAQDLAVAKIEGQPARNPSFWIKKVHFTRRYQKIGEYWLPREDTSTSDVKIFGKHTLAIHYEDYRIGDSGPR